MKILFLSIVMLFSVPVLAKGKKCCAKYGGIAKCEKKPLHQCKQAGKKGNCPKHNH